LRAGAENKNIDLWKKAEAAFEAALAIDPRSARAATNLAHTLAWQGKPKKDVAAAYLHALELAPADESVLRNAYTWTPPEERVETFQKLADAQPKDVTRKLYQASALSGVKQHEKALEVLSDAS